MAEQGKLHVLIVGAGEWVYSSTETFQANASLKTKALAVFLLLKA
jgi:hypothetical protein